MITTAFVKIWNKTLGAVGWDTETSTASFEYDSKFINTKSDLTPLKMSIVNSNKRVF